MHSHCLVFVKGNNMSKEKAVDRVREGNRRWNRKRRIEAGIETDVGHHDHWLAWAIHKSSVMTSTQPPGNGMPWSPSEAFAAELPALVSGSGSTCSGDVGQFLQERVMAGASDAPSSAPIPLPALCSPIQTSLMDFLPQRQQQGTPAATHAAASSSTATKRKRPTPGTGKRSLADCPAAVLCECPDKDNQSRGRRHHTLLVKGGPSVGERCARYKWLHQLPPYTA